MVSPNEEGSAMADILLAEDSPILSDIYASTLETVGHSVARATSASEVHEMLDKKSFALVLLALHLPDMDTPSLLRRIKSAENGPSIIVITPYSLINHAMEAMRHGAHDFLSKPFPMARLVVTVNNALTTHRLHGELAQHRAPRVPRWRSWASKMREPAAVSADARPDRAHG